MGHEEVVQHSPPVVSSEHVQLLVPRHDGVLAALGSDKLLATRQLLPTVYGLRGRAEVERQVFLPEQYLPLLALLRNLFPRLTVHPSFELMWSPKTTTQVWFAVWNYINNALLKLVTILN